MPNKPVKRKVIAKPSFTMPVTDYADASSLKALHAGTATAHQQQIALNWILRNAAMCKSLAFDPDSNRMTDFALGRQFVGHAIVYAIEQPVENFPKQN